METNKMRSTGPNRLLTRSNCIAIGRLSKLAASKNKSVQDLVNGQIDHAVEGLLEAAK